MKEYTISQISQMLDIPASTLRYYESEGLMETVHKNNSGHRCYNENDIRRINFIKIMKSAGISIEQIKLYVDLFHEGLHTIPQRKEILIKQRQILLDKEKELHSIIQHLEDMIENYEDTLVKREIERKKKDRK